MASRGSMDSLVVVQSIISEIKLGSRLSPPKIMNPSDSSNFNDLSMNGLGSIAENVPSVSKGGKSFRIGSRLPHSAALLAPKFTNDAVGLRYLAQHAVKCLRSLKYAEQVDCISRSYLVELLEKLVSHAMLNDAKSLMAGMKESVHFQPPPYFEDYFVSLAAADQTGVTIEYLKQVEKKHGAVPDSVLIKAVEPYIATQNWESVDQLIFGSLAQPSTMASNLLLKSLVYNNLISKSKSVFHQLLELNQNSQGKLGADSNTFTIMMSHFASEGDVKQLDLLMRTLLNTPTVVLKPVHFEIFIDCFSKRQEWPVIVQMGRIILNKGMTHFSEHTSTQLIWAYVHTKHSSGLGLNLHRTFTNPALADCLPYLKVLNICYSTSKPLFGSDYSAEQQKIRTKIAALESASTDTLQPEVDTKQEKRIPSTSSRKVPRIDYTALIEFIDSEMKKRPFPESRAKELITMYHTDHSAMLKLFKEIIEENGKETSSEICEMVLKNLEAQELSTALSWIDNANIPSHMGILAQRLRGHCLAAQSPLQSTMMLGKVSKQVEKTLSEFQRLNGTPLSWEALKYLLRTYYQLRNGQAALSILESRLPSQQELFLAPSAAFLPPTSPNASTQHKTSNSTLKSAESKRQSPEKVDYDRFRIPTSIALDFYHWCLISNFSVIKRSNIDHELRTIAHSGENVDLSAQQIRSLLSHVQLIRRMPAVQRTVKDGWKTKYLKSSL